MKPLPFREVRRKLLKAGFVDAGQTGSHIKYARFTDSGTITATVPRHKEVASGLSGVFFGRRDYQKPSSINCEVNQGRRPISPVGIV